MKNETKNWNLVWTWWKQCWPNYLNSLPEKSKDFFASRWNLSVLEWILLFPDRNVISRQLSTMKYLKPLMMVVWVYRCIASVQQSLYCVPGYRRIYSDKSDELRNLSDKDKSRGRIHWKQLHCQSVLGSESQQNPDSFNNIGQTLSTRWSDCDIIRSHNEGTKMMYSIMTNITLCVRYMD